MRALGFLLSLVGALPTLASQAPPTAAADGTGVLRGHVVDREGRPVASVRVKAARPSLLTGIVDVTAEARSDGKGAFSILRCPAGPLWVRAEHAGFTPKDSGVTVQPATTTEIEIVLQRGGRIVGSVRNRAGQPLTRAMVSFVPASGVVSPEDRPPVPVRADGTFELRQVVAESGVLVAAIDPHSSDPRIAAEAIEVRDDETTTAELVLPEVVISGRVTRSGAPGTGLRVRVVNKGFFTERSTARRAYGLPEETIPGTEATTDADGAFTLTAHAPGPASVQVSTLDHATRFPSRDIEIPDSDTYDLELAVGGSALVSGTVTDRTTGRPLATASVCAREGRPGARPERGKPNVGGGCASTDEEGAFRLELKPGEYTLSARHALEGYRRLETPVSVPDSGLDDLRLSIEKAPSITVRALDAGGRPVANALVTACDGEGKRVFRGGGIHGPITDAEGRFVFLELEPQPYSVFMISLPGGAVGFRPDVLPGPDEAVVTLRPGSKVVVRVVGPDGPAASAEVYVQGIDGHPVAVIHRGHTDAQGVALLSMPAGTIDVTVKWGPLEGRGIAVVPTGGEGDVTVALAPAPARTR